MSLSKSPNSERSMKKTVKAWAVVSSDDTGGAITGGYTGTKCGGAMHLPHMSVFLHRHDAQDACRETKGEQVIPIKISPAK